jgi:hypothetical protein
LSRPNLIPEVIVTTFLVETQDSRAVQFLNSCHRERHKVLLLPSGIAIKTELIGDQNQPMYSSLLTINRLQKLCGSLASLGINRTPATLTTGDVTRYFRLKLPYQEGTFWIGRVSTFGKGNITTLTDYLHRLGLKWMDEC